MHTPKDNVNQPLYIVTAIFNPQRFKQRWKLYRDFQKHVREAGATLITIEAALGEREFALEDHAYPNDAQHSGLLKSSGPAPVPQAAKIPSSRFDQDYIKIRVDDSQELWLKENLLNLGVHHLPPDWKYVAFVDADVQLTRPDWVSETLHALQHYSVTQMLSTAVDLSPTYEPLQVHRSFGYNYTTGLPSVTGYGGNAHGKAQVFHPGFAWAWRREALDQVGGLIDKAITGPADHHMAWALVGEAGRSVHGGVTEAYKVMVNDWQDAAAPLQKNVGYIDGTLLHHWHGRKIARGYETRWKILIDNRYDPAKDVRYDSRGVLRLAGNKLRLRDDPRRYFRSRNEDSIDVPDGDYHLVGPKPGWP